MSENKDDKLVKELSEELQSVAEHEQENNGKGKKPKKKRSKLRIALYIIGGMVGLGLIGFISLVVYIYILSL